jgi:hypothetical protein
MLRALPARHHGAARVGLGLSAAIVIVLIGSFAVRAAISQEIARERRKDLVAAAAGGFSDMELIRRVGGDPAAARLAASLSADGVRLPSYRPAGWARLDIDTPPTLNLGVLSMADARRINGVIPDSALASPPAAPFVPKTTAPERAMAQRCLTTAIYYEAALEPRAGQEAVAQVVLNRVRHPGYPQSVCGVVFQGADRPGCQFSFACDGSMARAPAAWAWKDAENVAKAALDGHVMKIVGTATHYHTTWVMAPWTPTLVKVGRIGGHIFFRPPGPDGAPSAFNAVYRGGEIAASRTDRIGKPQALPADAALTLASYGAPDATGEGRLIVVPASAMKSGRSTTIAGGWPGAGPVYGKIGQDGGFQVVAPMHAMIALRARAARAAAQSAKARAAAAQAASAPPP